MNHPWVVLVIPLIAFAVWLLSSLIKEAEDPRKDPRRRDGDPSRPRRPASDVDRFLAQHRQRRSETERPRDPIAEPFAPTSRQPPEPRPRERPAREPARPTEERRPARSREATPAARTAPRRLVLDQPQAPPTQAKPVVLELVREPIADRAVPPPPPASASASAPAPPAPLSALRAPDLAPTITKNEPLPPLGKLLSSPQSARLAFILREIIDPPLCLRRRHS